MVNIDGFPTLGPQEAFAMHGKSLRQHINDLYYLIQISFTLYYKIATIKIIKVVNKLTREIIRLSKWHKSVSGKAIRSRPSLKIYIPYNC